MINRYLINNINFRILEPYRSEPIRSERTESLYRTVPKNWYGAVSPYRTVPKTGTGTGDFIFKIPEIWYGTGDFFSPDSPELCSPLEASLIA